jgi:heme oxygenase (mycobilin-producing)
MTVVRINAITVPADSGDELARRFAARAGAVDGQDGFEGFELLKPTDGRTTWLVVTRWRDEESFRAWQNSPAFGQGHRSAAGGDGGAGPAHDGEARHTHGGEAVPPPHTHSSEAAPPGQSGGGEARAPVATSSELWSYDIAGGSAR